MHFFRTDLIKLTFKVDPGHLLKPLLSSYIPQLQSHNCVVGQIQNLQSEVDTYRGFATRGDKIVNITFDQTGFSHTQFPDDQNFEEMLLLSTCSGGHFVGSLQFTQSLYKDYNC